MPEQYHAARKKLLRYNFIVITEYLKHSEYAAAIERLFDVPGVAETRFRPFCEVESHWVNDKIPLIIKPETAKNLTVLNQFDIRLYDEMKDCLSNDKDYDFPAWDATRFEMNETIQESYTEWEKKNKGSPDEPPKKFLARFKNITWP